MTRLRSPILFRLCLLGLCLLVGFSFGFSWLNVGAQATYMLAPMKAITPAFIPSDWLTHQTYLYHGHFVYLAVLLNYLGSLPWTAALLNLALIFFSFLLLFSLLRRLNTPYSDIASLLLVVLIAVHRTKSVAVTFIFDGGLQPAVVASFFWLVAIVALVWNRAVVSGLALAAGGFFHVNFLVLGFPAFGLFQLLLGWPGLVRRSLIQLAPSAVLLAFELPTLLSASSESDADRAREIFQTVRSPGHYIPFTHINDFIPFIFWVSLGLFALGWVRGRDERRKYRALILSFLIPVIVATLLTTIIFVPQISQLFVWRVAPFAVLISQIIIIHALMETAAGRVTSGKLNLKPLLIISAASFAVWLIWYWAPYIETAHTAILILALLSGLMLLMHCSRVPSLGAIGSRINLFIWLPVAVVCIAATPVLGEHLYRTISSSRLLPTEGRDDQQLLFEWVRTTPHSARFVTPPGVGRFRLAGQRAIIVDWQSTPILPSEIVEWYRRLEEVSGIKNVGSLSEAENGYGRMRPDQLEALAERYDLDYAVFRTPPPPAAAGHPVVYGNDSFVVISLPEKFEPTEE